jgi:hypothetical protein
LNVALRLLPALLVLAVAHPAHAETLEVEELVGDGSLQPATLRLLSDAVRAAALRHGGETHLEVLASSPDPAPAAACDLKHAAARSAQFVVCGEYARVEGTFFATLRLLDVSGKLLGTQKLEGSAKALLSKVDGAADRLLAARWTGHPAAPPSHAAATLSYAAPPAQATAPAPGRHATAPPAQATAPAPGRHATDPHGAAPPAPPGVQAASRNPGDLRTQCEHGSAWACVEVARSYGIVKNPAQANPWVRHACDLRSPEACAVLGEQYERGHALPVDFVMAAKLYDFSCSAGMGDACCSYGRLVVDGRGPPKDVRRAKAYFDRGCQLGSGIACADAGYWSSRPILVTGMFPSPRTAFEYYERACELKEPNGCQSLAGYYETGYGVAEDTFRAQHYYDKACQLGREDSCADRDRLARENSAREVHVYIHHRR